MHYMPLKEIFPISFTFVPLCQMLKIKTFLNFLKKKREAYYAEKLRVSCARAQGVTNFTLPLWIVPFSPLILETVKHQMKPEDPAIVVVWNLAGFDEAGLRNGVAGQTKAAIIAHFTGAPFNAVDACGMNTVFVFDKALVCAQCLEAIPAWARHVNGLPDVAIHTMRINKLPLDGAIEFEPINWVFNQLP